MNKITARIIAFLLLIVGVLSWLIFVPKAKAPSVNNNIVTPSKPTTTAPAPLHERVIVTFPKNGSTVAKTFDVNGEAPGNWYFEATFPIQVRNPEGDVIGRSHANAQSDWMTTEQVKFSATVNIEGNYTGPATLILLRDNPSGLPENDDSLEVSITIK